MLLSYSAAHAEIGRLAMQLFLDSLSGYHATAVYHCHGVLRELLKPCPGFLGEVALVAIQQDMFFSSALPSVEGGPTWP